MVEKRERPDHPTLRERQHAPDLEAAEIAPPRGENEIDHGRLFILADLTGTRPATTSVRHRRGYSSMVEL